MDTLSAPLEGARGVDPQDVVVWFGSDGTRSGWSQRILTVEGIKHRAGDDAHSKHEAEARTLVDMYYRDTARRLSSCHQREHASGASLESEGDIPKTDETMWLPMPRVRSKKKTISDALQMRGCSSSPHLDLSSVSTVACNNLEISASGASTRDALDTAQHSAAAATSHHGRLSWQHGSSTHPVAMPRDSLTLSLKRRCDDASAHANELDDRQSRRPSSALSNEGRRSVSGAAGASLRRPSSAASIARRSSNISELNSKSAIPSGPRDSGAVVADFPPSQLCRDLNATIALKRAAAVLEEVDRQASHHTEDDSANWAHALSALREPLPATMDALRKSLGTSIMHTIKSTNAHQQSLLDPIVSALPHMSQLQRDAYEREIYKHIPKTEAARMQLRDGLDELQTTFARREIQADLDAFKHRAAGARQRRCRGVDTGTTDAQAGSGSAPRSSGASDSITATSLKRMLMTRAQHSKASRQRHGAPQFGAALAGVRELTNHTTVDYSSHIYAVSANASKLQRDPMRVPVQSKITIGERTFLYSELFRPAVQNK